MRAIILAVAAASGLAAAAPLLAQDDGEELDADTAMECGVRVSFYGGVIEGDDPDGARDLLNVGATWMAMGLNRLADEEAAFESILDTKTDNLVGELEALESEDAALELLVGGVTACDLLRGQYRDEFEEMYELVAED